ncbi:MAG: hypothetical protein HRU17_17035, partial [Polyangiaceae bacterium]|nr:hypothetical protein [Polyangiaceae bacterium]
MLPAIILPGVVVVSLGKGAPRTRWLRLPAAVLLSGAAAIACASSETPAPIKKSGGTGGSGSATGGGTGTGGDPGGFAGRTTFAAASFGGTPSFAGASSTGGAPSTAGSSSTGGSSSHGPDTGAVVSDSSVE